MINLSFNCLHQINECVLLYYDYILTWFILLFKQEMLTKWEHFVKEHQAYREKYRDFTEWLTQTTERVGKISEASDNKEQLQICREQLQVKTLNK